jgi:hypothetical protein
MLRFLTAGWLTRRLAGPIGRLIPNPYLRAVALTGAGTLVARMLRKRGTTRRPGRR